MLSIEKYRLAKKISPDFKCAKELNSCYFSGALIDSDKGSTDLSAIF